MFIKVKLQLILSNDAHTEVPLFSHRNRHTVSLSLYILQIYRDNYRQAYACTYVYTFTYANYVYVSGCFYKYICVCFT